MPPSLRSFCPTFPRPAGQEYQDHKRVCVGGSCLPHDSQTARRQRDRDTLCPLLLCSIQAYCMGPLTPPATPSLLDGATHTPAYYWMVPLTPQPVGWNHSHSGSVFSHTPVISENTFTNSHRNVLQESSRCLSPAKLISQLFFLENSKDHTFSINLLGF